MFLVILVVVVALVELVVILQVGEALGAAWTILLLVLTSLGGAVLLRHEGRRAWRAFREVAAEGRWPGDEVTQGALVIVGGTLLLLPGFVTDGVGLLLLLPPTRAGLSRFVRARATPDSVKFLGAAGRRASRRRRDGGRHDVLDVEVVEVERQPRDDEGHGDDGHGGLPPGPRRGA